MYDNLDAQTGERVWTDLCRGPHLPTTRRIPAFKLMRTAAAYWRGEREEPAAAAHLRHRLGQPRRPQGLPGPAGGGGQARPPQARRRTRPVQLPGRARLRAGRVPPQGRRAAQGDGGLLAGQARRGRLRVRQHPAHHQGPAVRDLRAPGVVRRRHVPADAPRRGVRAGRRGAQARPGLLPQADELPDALPDLPGARPVLPRAAAAAVRVRHRLPLREVRCRPRPDPGARA